MHHNINKKVDVRTILRDYDERKPNFKKKQTTIANR
jgi:hypothetical protein